MVFIFACWKKASVLFVSAMLLPSLAWADFSILSAAPEFRDGKLFVSAEMDLALNDKVEEALSKGIPLYILIEVRLQRPRAILWNETIGQWSLTRKISYHALSSQYLVGTVGDTRIESFTSLAQALRGTGSLSDHELPMNHFPGKDEAYSLELRASLNIEALPAPLRPVAYTSMDWRLNSGWTTWQNQP